MTKCKYFVVAELQEFNTLEEAAAAITGGQFEDAPKLIFGVQKHYGVGIVLEKPRRQPRRKKTEAGAEAEANGTEPPKKRGRPRKADLPVVDLFTDAQ